MIVQMNGDYDGLTVLKTDNYVGQLLHSVFCTPQKMV